jgi:hypothetical protein
MRAAGCGNFLSATMPKLTSGSSSVLTAMPAEPFLTRSLQRRSLPECATGSDACSAANSVHGLRVYTRPTGRAIRKEVFQESSFVVMQFASGMSANDAGALVNAIEGYSIDHIFGYPDLKFH